MEVLEIIETQLLQRQSDGSLVVESLPLLSAPGASKFTTHALFIMSDEVNGKQCCKVSSTTAPISFDVHFQSAELSMLLTMHIMRMRVSLIEK